MSVATVCGEGHGPAFGLAPPTLGTGQWSTDTMAMGFSTEEDAQIQLREMVGYGIEEDLQAIVGFPLSPTIDELEAPPNTRSGSMMFGSGTEVEGSLLWRFHRVAPGGGSRFESTLQLGGTLPTDSTRANLKLGPSVGSAVVSGYASRTIYSWAGVGYRYHFERDNDRLGALPFATVVFGWRPPMFQKDYPYPDWRLFVESTAEFPQSNEINGRSDPNSGGEKFLVGPSVLGLYGQWGIEAGVLFPIHQDLDGNRPKETFRAKVVFTYWF